MKLVLGRLGYHSLWKSFELRVIGVNLNIMALEKLNERILSEQDCVFVLYGSGCVAVDEVSSQQPAWFDIFASRLSITHQASIRRPLGSSER